MASYNLKKDSQAYLVVDEVYPENYQHRNPYHYFSLRNLSDGIVDKITSLSGVVSSNKPDTTISNSLHTVESTDSPFLGALTFKNGGKGMILLPTEDARSFENNTSWEITLWFNVDDAAPQSQDYTGYLIGSGTSFAGWGLEIIQRVGQTTLDLKLRGESPNNSSDDVVVYENVVTPGQWNYLSIKALPGAPAKSLRLHLNDTVLGTVNTLPRFVVNPLSQLPLSLGARVVYLPEVIYSTDNFAGSIAEVKFYDSIDSTPESTEFYNLQSTGESYKLELSENFSFSQTSTDKSSMNKTLNRPEDYFEKSSIVKVNPANFEFKIPVFKENDLQVVHDKLINSTVFSLYIVSTEAVYKLDKCVITNGTYGIERSTPLTLTVSGEASKLSKLLVNASGFTSPGVHQPMTSGRKYLRGDDISIELDGVEISSEVFSISAELQNDIKWVENRTLYDTLQLQYGTIRTLGVYPENFIINKKIFSGSIGRYSCDTNSNLENTFSVNSSLKIKVGEKEGVIYGFEFDMLTCSFTNRSSSDEIFTQNYDWRLTDNSRPLSSTIKYINI